MPRRLPGVALLAAGIVLGMVARGAAQTPTLSWQATMVVPAGSTPLIAANVTMAPNTIFPTALYWVQAVNTGSNSATICWKNGNAQTATGCLTLVAGASDRVNLNGTVPGALTSPTLASGSGTTISFHD